MRNIDEDTITQAVIARHAGIRDARLRELMTSLVQHLHAFAREVKLSEAEWAQGVHFLTAVGRSSDARRQEFGLLSDTLGLSMLVAAQNQRKPKGCTEATVAAPFPSAGFVPQAPGGELAPGAPCQPCFVRGHVKDLQGRGIAGAEVQAWPAEDPGAGEEPPTSRGAALAPQVLRTGADGGFQFRGVVAPAYPIPHDGPVGRMLEALGRHPWRPAHLQFLVTAPGHERLHTQVFRDGDRYLDSDAVFGVRKSLITDWVRNEPGPTPDGGTSAVPFYTVAFDFVLNKA